MKFAPAKESLYGETLTDLQNRMERIGQPKFRATQITDWLYRKRVKALDDMTNLPKSLREHLAAETILDPGTTLLVKKSDDITEKLLIEEEDRSLIETVLIRYPQKGVGQEDSRRTICVSSQVGCAYGCKFCASGLAGFKRNLSAAEIVHQFIVVSRLENERGFSKPDEAMPIDNIVFMGMGEPLANYDEVIRAITILNADWGLNFGARRITVSTSGLVPQIRKLATESVPFRLAVSLHGATNAVRDQIMPINRKYPLEELIPAIKAFSAVRGRMVTLEFILIEGVNDSLEQADALAEIARDLHAHVNLIPYNTVEGLPWKRPSIPQQMDFYQVLVDARVSATIRKEKGHDISAACGQLRLQTEKSRETQV